MYKIGINIPTEAAIVAINEKDGILDYRIRKGSIDKFTIPALSEIVSPITAKINGEDIVIIVIIVASKFSI